MILIFCIIMSKIKISVVGLCYNGSDIVPEFIESIYRSSLRKEEIEIIIVDNASPDGSAEYISKKYPNVNVIARKINIGSGAHNDALRIVKGEYCLFTDSDMKMEKHCLENLYKTAKKMGEKVVLLPTLYEYDIKKKLMPSYSVLSRSFYSTFVKPKDNDLTLKEVFMGGFVFLHRDTAKKLQYIFDNDYFLYAEDFDICLRIRLQGFKVYICPNAIMYNKPPSQTVLKYITQRRLTYYLERNLLITFFKICSVRTILLYLPYVVIIRKFALLRDLVRLDFRMFLTRVKAYLWVFTHFSLVMKKRKMTQKMRKVSDKKIFEIADDKYFLKSILSRHPQKP